MNIDEEIFKKLDTWVFNVETQAGEKLHVIDAIDLKEIIPEIMEVVKKFNYIPCCTELKSVDRLGYLEWKDKLGLIKQVDKGCYKLNGKYITINEVLDMYEVYWDTF